MKKTPYLRHMKFVRERLYGAIRQKLWRFFAIVSRSAAFVSALLRAIKRLYCIPEFIRERERDALDTYYILKE